MKSSNIIEIPTQESLASSDNVADRLTSEFRTRITKLIAATFLAAHAVGVDHKQAVEGVRKELIAHVIMTLDEPGESVEGHAVIRSTHTQCKDGIVSEADISVVLTRGAEVVAAPAESAAPVDPTRK